MDSSLNISSETINLSKYLLENKDSLDLVLNNLNKLSDKSKSFFKDSLTKDDRIDNQLLEINQFQTHGYAWFETYRIGLRETLNWFTRLDKNNEAKEIDASITLFAFAEYLTQISNGIMMSQSEIVRPKDLGLDQNDFLFMKEESVKIS